MSKISRAAVMMVSNRNNFWVVISAYRRQSNWLVFRPRRGYCVEVAEERNGPKAK